MELHKREENDSPWGWNEMKWPHISSGAVEKIPNVVEVSSGTVVAGENVPIKK